MASTRLLLDDNAELMASFLTHAGHPDEVRVEWLAAECVKLRAERRGEPIGYVWLHWVPELLPNALALHACIAADWRHRWLDRATVWKVFTMAELMGAAYLLTQPREDAPLHLPRMYKRLGFIEPVPGCFIRAL